MPVYTLSGIDVEFPFEAYKCQIAYMECVIRALKQCSNALLESPTGTGKTLCLLCAALAWRRAVARGEPQTLHAADADAQRRDVAEVPTAAASTASMGEAALLPAPQTTPRIVYASRTHSQLAQVVSELRRTEYRPKMCVFGSREQSCVHPDVSELRGMALTHACQALTKANGCKFYANLQRQKQSPAGVPEAPGLLDIEEFSALCRTKELCPFYYARELQEDAELLLLPYNYLIDPKSSRALGLQGRRDVLIFDEAHNMERVCVDAASIDLTTATVAQAIAELDKCTRLVTAGTGDDQAIPEVDVTAVIGGHAPAPREGGVELHVLYGLKELLLALEKQIDALPIGLDGTLVREGCAMHELFAAVHVTVDTVDELLLALTACAQMLCNALELAGPGRSSALQTLADHVRTLFDNAMDPTDFRVYVAASTPGGSSGISALQRLPAGRTVSFWCLNPGVAMRALLKANQVHSLLLTSGTLSPLDSFALELQVPFPVRLENDHVIAEDQAAVIVVKKGPSGVALNSSYHNRNSPKYLTDLGNAVVNFARAVPDGMLVFFPSYAMMETTVANWRVGGAAEAVWTRLSRCKHVVVEPRGSQAQLLAAQAEFDQALNAGSGAVFLGVCRGKLSEGIDFSDRAGRAVVITGIPMPPYKDPKVMLKREFLDQRVREARESSRKGGMDVGAAQLTGEEWYTQQAMRAINQAVGRVVRHRFDFGAVLLCDERFAKPRFREALSRWLRPRVAVCDGFGEANQRAIRFFKAHRERERERVHADALAQRAAQQEGQACIQSAFKVSGQDGTGASKAMAQDASEEAGAGGGASAVRSVSEVDCHACPGLSLAAQLAREGSARMQAPLTLQAALDEGVPRLAASSKQPAGPRSVARLVDVADLGSGKVYSAARRAKLHEAAVAAAADRAGEAKLPRASAGVARSARLCKPPEVQAHSAARPAADGTCSPRPASSRAQLSSRALLAELQSLLPPALFSRIRSLLHDVSAREGDKDDGGKPRHVRMGDELAELLRAHKLEEHLRQVAGLLPAHFQDHLAACHAVRPPGTSPPRAASACTHQRQERRLSHSERAAQSQAFVQRAKQELSGEGYALFKKLMLRIKGLDCTGETSVADGRVLLQRINNLFPSMQSGEHLSYFIPDWLQEENSRIRSTMPARRERPEIGYDDSSGHGQGGLASEAKRAKVLDCTWTSRRD